MNEKINKNKIYRVDSCAIANELSFHSRSYQIENINKPNRNNQISQINSEGLSLYFMQAANGRIIIYYMQATNS